VGADEELWKTGKSAKSSENDIVEEDDTLDLSAPSPESDRDNEIDLEKIDDSKASVEDDNWLPSAIGEEEGISIRTVGIVGTVTILLLTGALVLILNEQKIVVNVPNEKYEEYAVYNIEGAVNFESTVDVPLPLGFIDNDVVINELDINFGGEMRAGIKAPSTQAMDGYGDMRSVFKKYIEQTLDDIDGTITEEGENPAKLENGQITSHQYQFIDIASLEIVRSEIESNASYSDTLTGERWYWQSATDWVPRESDTGLLPHGESYIGKTLTEGNKGVVNEGGIQFNWKVEDGGKIKDVQTALLKIETSYVSDSILGYEYQYQYSFDFYMSEISSLPLKFEMNLYSDATSPGGKLYSVNIEYKGASTQVEEGYTDVPITSWGKTESTPKTGEFESWIDGAPALGNGTAEHECGISNGFNLQTGIQKGRDEISEFDSYIKDQMAKNKDAFVVEANYTAKAGQSWNFTMAHNNEQAQNIDGWIMRYNNSDISGEVDSIDNPIMTMEDIPQPLTVCSAEEVMTDFEEIASWAINDQTKVIDYSQVKLILGQNLVSKQSLASPTSIVNFGSLNLINIISDLSEGNLNPNDYSDNIDVDTAGSYAYFIDRKGGSESLGYNYQELAGVDAKDGLVLFNLQSRNSA
tara:strand:- start:218 stop:2131 length:1914 start_codon:yes stop_codon:yes gene_type:complete